MKKRQNSGVVLVFVLIFTVAICTLVIFFYGRTNEYTGIFTGMQQTLLLENTAETGVEIGKAVIGKEDKTSLPVTEESPGLVTKEYAMGDIRLYLTIADENAKINPNMIYYEENDEKKSNTLILDAFNRLFTVLGYPETMPASILDWIDEDGLQRPGGAESFYYRKSGCSYMPPNRNLYSAEEILLIRDFTKETVFGDSENDVKGLINFITSFSDGKINVNTCEPEVLSALGFPAADVEKITAERQRRPIEQRFMLNVNKEVFLKNRSIIVFESSYFLLDAAAVDSAGRRKCVRAYVKRSKKELNTVRMEVR